MKSGTWCFY